MRMRSWDVALRTPVFVGLHLASRAASTAAARFRRRPFRAPASSDPSSRGAHSLIAGFETWISKAAPSVVASLWANCATCGSETATRTRRSRMISGGRRLIQCERSTSRQRGFEGLRLGVGLIYRASFRRKTGSIGSTIGGSRGSRWFKLRSASCPRMSSPGFASLFTPTRQARLVRTTTSSMLQTCARCSEKRRRRRSSRC